jgi:hypothetical protein
MPWALVAPLPGIHQKSLQLRNRLSPTDLMVRRHKHEVDLMEAEISCPFDQQQGDLMRLPLLPPRRQHSGQARHAHVAKARHFASGEARSGCPQQWSIKEAKV